MIILASSSDTMTRPVTRSICHVLMPAASSREVVPLVCDIERGLRFRAVALEEPHAHGDQQHRDHDDHPDGPGLGGLTRYGQHDQHDRRDEQSEK